MNTWSATPLFSFLAALLIGLAIALALVTIFQRRLLYFPQAVKADDDRLRRPLSRGNVTVMYSVHDLVSSKAIIYFGGNADYVADALPDLVEAFPDHSIYAMHYRGYGGSTGKAKERHLVADALALFDVVHKTHPHITAIGRSLGSGIALRLAVERPAVKLVLVTPYDSILAIAKLQFPYLPVNLLLIDRYESWRFASQVTVPTVLLVAENDRLIPRASSETLLSHFRSGVASMVVIAGTDHNSIVNDAGYLREIAKIDA